MPHWFRDGIAAPPGRRWLSPLVACGVVRTRLGGEPPPPTPGSSTCALSGAAAMTPWRTFTCVASCCVGGRWRRTARRMLQWGSRPQCMAPISCNSPIGLRSRRARPVAACRCEKQPKTKTIAVEKRSGGARAPRNWVCACCLAWKLGAPYRRAQMSMQIEVARSHGGRRAPPAAR